MDTKCEKYYIMQEALYSIPAGLQEPSFILCITVI